MKKLFTLLFVFALGVSFFSCEEDDVVSDPSLEEQQSAVLAASQTAIDAVVSIDESATGYTSDTEFAGWTLYANIGETPAVVEAATEVEVSTNITEDVTWSADNVYVLKNRVTVLDGATLTIEAGTVIKGDASQSGADAAVLMVARGGKLMAVGTAQTPIIFTSTDDNIEPGQMLGTTLDADVTKGKWGGLVILGKAPVSAKVDEPQIEGVPADDLNGLYGGTDATDNSGSIAYVSIRFGGAEIAEGSEINGLTLGGVGSGTSIHHIEVIANKDDGVEFFGGTVDVSELLVYAVGDDAIDIDQSYAGEVKNFTVYVDGNSDEVLEVDGREGAMDDTFTIMNGTGIALEGGEANADFKSKAKGSVNNVVLSGKIKLSASFDTETSELIEKEDAAYNAAVSELTFTNINTSQFTVYTKSFDQ
ncbi:MAG: hypothetical protein OCD76_22510 [Reichenbachiella sp.]